MATVDEVKYAAFEILGVAQNDVLSTSQDARATKAYNKVYAELNETGLATWVSAGTIPDELAAHVEALMAYDAANAYFISDNRYSRLVGLERQARREIRRLTQPDYESLDNPRDF